MHIPGVEGVNTPKISLRLPHIGDKYSFWLGRISVQVNTAVAFFVKKLPHRSLNLSQKPLGSHRSSRTISTACITSFQVCLEVMSILVRRCTGTSASYFFMASCSRSRSAPALWKTSWITEGCCIAFEFDSRLYVCMRSSVLVAVGRESQLTVFRSRACSWSAYKTFLASPSTYR